MAGTDQPEAVRKQDPVGGVQGQAPGLLGWSS